MSSVTPKAIVFNCHYNGLSIIQELASHGVPCIAMDSRRSIGTYSRHASYVNCPDPSINESQFIDFLYDYCLREPVKPVLFPTNDQWAAAISKHKERLLEVSHLCVADWETVSAVIEKDRFYALGHERGYPTPKTWRATDVANAAPTDYPIAAKPIWRRNSADRDNTDLDAAMDRLRLTVFIQPEELRSFLETESRWLNHLIFQTYVPGLSDSMYTVGIYADSKHRILGVFTGKKVRGYPADIGDCIVGEAQSVPDEVIATIQRITEELKLSGIAEFEFKQNPNTRAFTLIEINPRSWSWVGITPHVGVSLPLIAYRDLTDDSVNTHRTLQTTTDGSVRYAKVVDDFINVCILYRFSFPQWAQSPWAWRRDLHRNRKVVYAEFHAGDYRVAIMSIVLQLKRLGRLAAKSIIPRIGNR